MIDKSDVLTIAFAIAVANKHSHPAEYAAQVVDAAFPEVVESVPLPVIDAPEATA